MTAAATCRVPGEHHLSARLVAVAGYLPLSLLLFGASVATLASTRLGMGGDDASYFALAEGKTKEASALYRYRVLVPLVARLLP